MTILYKLYDKILPIKYKKYQNIHRYLTLCNILGITANPDYGGSGGKYLDHIIINEEISRYKLLCLSVFSIFTFLSLDNT